MERKTSYEVWNKVYQKAMEIMKYIEGRREEEIERFCEKMKISRNDLVIKHIDEAPYVRLEAEICFDNKHIVVVRNWSPFTPFRADDIQQRLQLFPEFSRKLAEVIAETFKGRVLVGYDNGDKNIIHLYVNVIGDTIDVEAIEDKETPFLEDYLNFKIIF